MFMGSTERRLRHKQTVKQLILDKAQLIAVSEGWGAVTIRRLAEEIEYTLPVIYTHFKSKEEIISEIAKYGFVLLEKSLTQSFNIDSKPRTNAVNLALAYCKFAQDNKALYQAMYGPDGISSFYKGNPIEGEQVFFLVKNNLDSLVVNGAKIPDTWQATKLIWSTLHGLVSLDFIGRISDQSTNQSEIVTDFINILYNSWGL
jgi:AcrR family transcriptional regulator